MAEPVVLKVRMSCGGCAGAVKRALGKMEGVESFDVDLEQQKVTVKGAATPEAVLEAVSKTGKKAEFWKDDELINVTISAAKEEAAPPAAAARPEPAAAKDAAAAAAPETAALDATAAVHPPPPQAETAAAAVAN